MTKCIWVQFWTYGEDFGGVGTWERKESSHKDAREIFKRKTQIREHPTCSDELGRGQFLENGEKSVSKTRGGRGQQKPPKCRGQSPLQRALDNALQRRENRTTNENDRNEKCKAEEYDVRLRLQSVLGKPTLAALQHPACRSHVHPSLEMSTQLHMTTVELGLARCEPEGTRRGVRIWPPST